MSDSPLNPKQPRGLTTGSANASTPTVRRGIPIAIGGGLFTTGLAAFWLGADTVIAALLVAGGALTWLRAALTSKTPSLAELEESHRAARLKELTRYIGKARYLERVGNLGEQTAEQLHQASEQLKSFQDLLALKFSPTELTFGRYRQAAEQTFLAILDNLSSVASALNSIDVIDCTKIDSRLAELKEPNASNPAAEIKSLEERKILRESELTRVAALLAFNENAITEFSRLRAALAAVRTQKGEAEIDLDAAIAELALLASRAQHYALENKRDTQHGDRPKR